MNKIEMDNDKIILNFRKLNRDKHIKNHETWKNNMEID